ncbi:MAG: VanW family protein [Mycobacteriales bacterium]
MTTQVDRVPAGARSGRPLVPPGWDRLTHRGRLAAAVIAALAVLVLGYLADVAVAGDRVPQGVHVAGVAIGGKTRSAAAAALRAALDPRGRMPELAEADGVPVRVDPGAAGLRLDVERTLDAAGSRAWSPAARLWPADNVAPVLIVDRGALAAEVDKAAAAVDRPVVEGEVRFDGLTPVVVPPEHGRRLDRQQAAAALRAHFLLPGPAVRLRTAVVAPHTSRAALDAALATLARPAVAAPVVVQVAGKSLSVPPEALAPALHIAVDPSGHPTPRLDPGVLRAKLVDALRPVETPARDAGFVVVGNGIQVTPSATGLAVLPQALADAITPVLALPAPRSVTVGLAPSAPGLSTEQAQGFGIKEVIGTFTTRHPCCAPRVNNIHTIAGIVDRAVVRPGAEFSLNDFVGERDVARGFVDAPTILRGQFVDTVGGGISQFATTMFNAVFFSGLEDVTHTPHSYYISRYPPGREATVSFPQPDLRWRNDSPTGVLVKTSVTGTSVTVTFWGTKRFDIDSVSSERYNPTPFGPQYIDTAECQPAAGGPGFDIDVWRVFKAGGAELKREKFHTRYLAEPNFICGPPPAPAPPAPAPPAAAAAPTPAPVPVPAPTPGPSQSPAAAVPPTKR